MGKAGKEKPTVASGRRVSKTSGEAVSQPESTTGVKTAIGPTTFDQLVEFTPVYRVFVEKYGRDTALAWGRVKRWTDGDGVCFMALETMASELGMGRKHLQACLHRLVEAGELTAERQGVGKTVRYRMPRALQITQGQKDLRPAGRKGPAPQGESDLRPQGESDLLRENLKRESQERKELPPVSIDPNLKAAIEEARKRGKDNPEAYAAGMLRRGWKPKPGDVPEEKPDYGECRECFQVAGHAADCSRGEADDEE